MPDAIRAADLLACRALLRGGSRSFYAASLLLPRRVMEPATALYAFCRVADDLIDRNADPGAVDALHRRLDAIYAGTPDGHAPDRAPDRALAAVVARHRLPRPLLDGLLEGFAWDAAARRYDTLADLQNYAARVAGTVGATMAVLMGVRDAAAVARACDLGIAMQLSNIARDVGEDARAGRLYLPLQWLRDEGVDPDAFLAAPSFTPPLGRVVARLVDAAEALYARADAGIAALPLACRPGIGAARRLYAGIGRRVVLAGGNSVDARAVLPPAAKLAAIVRATAAALRSATGPAIPPLPAARHLVAAVAASPAPRPAPNRLVWLIELFADLEDRQDLASRPAR